MKFGWVHNKSVSFRDHPHKRSSFIVPVISRRNVPVLSRESNCLFLQNKSGPKPPSAINTINIMKMPSMRSREQEGIVCSSFVPRKQTPAEAWSSLLSRYQPQGTLSIVNSPSSIVIHIPPRSLCSALQDIGW